MTYNSSKEGIVDVAEDIGHTYGKEPLIIQSDLTVRAKRRIRYERRSRSLAGLICW